MQPNPARTNGHHFSALLRCPEAAWLEYFGNHEDRKPAPAYLRLAQREGLEHEKCYSERFYSNALTIPAGNQASEVERVRLTFEAIQRREPVILQAVVCTDAEVGIIDVLELRDGKYSVGEFKKATILRTEHTLQTSWYRELLCNTETPVDDSAFFIMGTGIRKTIDLGEVAQIYTSCREKLLGMRKTGHRPGAHLCGACASCDWRGVCMPTLVHAEHLSLLPGLDRSRVGELKTTGIHRWTQAKSVPNDRWVELGLTRSQILRINVAFERLLEGRATPRSFMRAGMLEEGVAVVLHRDDERTTAHGIRQIDYSIRGKTTTCVIQSTTIQQDLIDLANAPRLLFFGATDINGFQHFARESGIDELPPMIDVVDLVERFIHAPLPGLELPALLQFIDSYSSEDDIDRIAGLCTVISWIEDTVA